MSSQPSTLTLNGRRVGGFRRLVIHRAHRPQVVPAGFSIALKPEDAPYLFDGEGRSQWASASAELMATLAALHLFGHLEPTAQIRQFPVVNSAVTHNRGNESLEREQSTTKRALMPVNIQLSHHLMRVMLKLDFRSRPREENQNADDLTTQRCQNFSVDRRIQCKGPELAPSLLLHKFWETKSQFDAMRLQVASTALSEVCTVYI